MIGGFGGYHPVGADQGEAHGARHAGDGADRAAREHFAPTFQPGAVHRQGPFANLALAFHAAGNFLADEAALLVIDPTHDIHVHVGWENHRRAIVGSPFGHACRDPLGVPFVFRHIEADLGFRGNRAVRQLRGSHIGPAAFGDHVVREAFDLHVRAQAKHAKAFFQIVGGVCVDIDIDIVEGEHGEIVGNDLALRCEQSAVAHLAGVPVIDGMRHRAVEQGQHVRTGQANDCAVG